ncbi:MAG: hypothetical protein LBL19_07590, partial [Spirochaetaceae bacterium]|nr:hypothetical protein [Spirochaetaceae bacterium]
MKNTTARTFLCVLAFLLAMGCAVPLGQNFSISRETGQNGIYIVDYNLQTYVPIPVKGEQPVTTVIRGDVNVNVTWFKDNVEIENMSVFAEDTVYSAKIELSPQEGYLFNPIIAFAYHPGRVISQNDDTSSPKRTVSVTYNDSSYEVPVTDYNLQSYVPIPAEGEKAVTGFKDDDRGVKGTVQWSPGGPAASINRAAAVEVSSWEFAKEVQYTANITLEALPGWYFTEENFIYPDGVVQTQPSASSDRKKRDLSPVYHVTIINIFPPDQGSGSGTNPGGGGDGKNPDSKTNVIVLDNYITAPQFGAAPESGGHMDEYHSGVAVAWQPGDSVFEGKAYTANLTVTADSGYGLGAVYGFSYKGESIPFTFENNATGARMSIAFPSIDSSGSSGSGSKNLSVDLTGTIIQPKPSALMDFTLHTHGGLHYTTGTVSWFYGYAEVALYQDNYKAEIENTSGTGTGWIPVTPSASATFIGGKVYRAQIDLTTPDAGWFDEVKEFIYRPSDNQRVWDISFTTSNNGNNARVIIDFRQLTISWTGPIGDASDSGSGGSGSGSGGSGSGSGGSGSGSGGSGSGSGGSGSGSGGSGSG